MAVSARTYRHDLGLIHFDREAGTKWWDQQDQPLWAHASIRHSNAN
jgi:hypothetical protein